MDDGSRLPWIIALLLLFGAMFFAMTETAFSSSSRPRLKALSEMGNEKATKALAILDDFDKAISTILICTNIIHLSIASIVTLEVTRMKGLDAVAMATLATTLVVFFAGEMLPKSIAKRFAESLAMTFAGPLQFFMIIFTPLSALLSKIGNAASSLMKAEPELSVTEDELYEIIEDMTEEGTLDEKQGELISSAIQFGALTVESVLTPRMDVIAVNVNDSPETILSTIKNCTHSRLPVYDGSIDNIIGIISIRSYLKQYLMEGTVEDIRPLLRPPLFVHKSTKVDELLPLMSEERQNIAVVTDNFGGTLGIVTTEDILEEIVGEIWDEDDVVKEKFERISDNEIIVDGTMHVHDVFDILKYEPLDADPGLENKQMGAWALETFDKIPKVGDSFGYHCLTVSVEEMDHNRIKRLRVRSDDE